MVERDRGETNQVFGVFCKDVSRTPARLGRLTALTLQKHYAYPIGFRDEVVEPQRFKHPERYMSVWTDSVLNSDKYMAIRTAVEDTEAGRLLDSVGHGMVKEPFYVLSDRKAFPMLLDERDVQGCFVLASRLKSEIPEGDPRLAKAVPVAKDERREFEAMLDWYRRENVPEISQEELEEIMKRILEQSVFYRYPSLRIPFSNSVAEE
jgi:hypothetical protein